MIAKLEQTVESPSVSCPKTEQRLLLPDVSWEAYEMIGAALKDRPAVRLTYDRGNLEIMTTSPEHEKLKKRLGRLVETLAEEFNLPLETAGSMTFKRHASQRGLEVDDCFWIAHEAQMRLRQEWDPAVDPPPDLALEIEISRSFADRIDICASLRIPEVWCFNGTSLRVLILQPELKYRETESSPTFPGISIAGIVPFLAPNEAMDYLSTIRAFRAWVREQLARK
jgi:Uma2 family endonuclease